MHAQYDELLVNRYHTHTSYIFTLFACYVVSFIPTPPSSCFAFAATVLTFEPRNAIILDYQATLAQYINNGETLIRSTGRFLAFLVWNLVEHKPCTMPFISIHCHL